MGSGVNERTDVDGLVEPGEGVQSLVLVERACVSISTSPSSVA